MDLSDKIHKENTITSKFKLKVGQILFIIM